MTLGDDPYVYAGTTTLKNRFDIRDPAVLDRVERIFVAQRIAEGCPEGSFDLAHLQSIHRHLFQDVYDWADELRTMEIGKGSQQFQFRQYIRTGMADVHRRLVRSGFLSSLSPQEFARQAAVIIGDVNYIHPFREGNGRVQLQYLALLAERAGHPIDLERLGYLRWVEASQVSHGADYTAVEELILAAIRQR